MAEGVLANVASEIIKKAGSSVVKEIGLWWGLKDEIEKLERTVSTIQAVLVHAEEQYLENNDPVRTWLASLRAVLYDADDLLDHFSTMALQRQAMSGNKAMKEVSLFFSPSNRIVYGLKMAHKIKDLRIRLVEINANRSFHLDKRPIEKPVFLRRREQTHSSLPEIVIGRENDKENIVEFLKCDEGNLSIVSIVGFGGLGKTTLAQFAYNDDSVRNHFELRGWVCVSDDFDVKLIVEKILESLTGDRVRNCEMETLKNVLHGKINGKKFLIVLDDIWNDNPEEWFQLSDLLVGGAEGSKLIITTRLMNVAKVARSNLIHELEGLSEVESWSLFEKIAFKQGEVASPALVSLGKEIVAKCGGVPLALRSIGGLLYSKDRIEEWKFFSDNELSKVNKRDGNILETLRLSYNHLPSHLKHCFAYCSLFPKDYKFRVKKLIHLWMAQGYTELVDSSQSFEATCYEYFLDLLSMSFFQEVERDSWGNIESCKMHDLMHDLAKSVAGDGINSLDMCQNVDCIGKTTRHVSFVRKGDINSLSPALLNARKARTFLYVGGKWFNDNRGKGQWHEMFSKLKSLRMLDLNGQIIGNDESLMLHSIDKLKHLRYLDLSNNEMERLPNSITRLWNLQVLKLDKCRYLKELPKNIYKLVNLKHLGIDECYKLTHMPVGIGKLTSLEHLSLFVVGKDKPNVAGLHELHSLNKLRGELMIFGLRYAGENDCQAANLKEKEHLQFLLLHWFIGSPVGYFEVGEDCYKIIGDEVEKEEKALEALRPHQNLKGFSLHYYRGIKSPSWLPSLTCLMEIGIYDCKNIKYLPAMDHLPSLQSLYIEGLSSLERIDAKLNPMFFRSLKYLPIFDCPNLEGWSVGTESISTAEQVTFHCFSHLFIDGCPKLNIEEDA